MKAIERIKQFDPCCDAIEWLGDRTVEQMVNECKRGDWLLWLAKKAGVDERKFTLAKGLCAQTVIHLMTDQRSKDAVQAAIDFGNGKIDSEELAKASYAASAAYYAASASSAAAAADVASASSAASAADVADYAADAADYAADAAYYAADAAYYAADVADYAASAAFADRDENRLLTAKICREAFGKELIQILSK